MFRYFGFGSNLNITSLKAKGVFPVSARKGVLHGWSLHFNVQHFFRHEGGVGNIEPSNDPSDKVIGIVYECPDESLAPLDAVEAYGHGYDRITVDIEVDGELITAFTYVGMPEFIDNNCLPCQRYLNILVSGAEAADLDPVYIEKLRVHPVLQQEEYPIFTHPEGAFPTFYAATLAEKPLYTAIHGAVFDMSEARPLHHYLKGFFGGRDMTLFHIKRLDISNGRESINDLIQGQLNETQLSYLNCYLNEYDREYQYVGRYLYE